MSDSHELVNRRVLIIDDSIEIQRDFAKILQAEHDDGALAHVESLLFGMALNQSNPLPAFHLEFATQGRQGVQLAHAALIAGQPFALAFIDMRMPPGWDGLETIEHLWQVDSNIQVVVCSAYSDYDWSDFVKRLGHSDKLLMLKKPFEPIEVLQCATALTRKWQQERLLLRQLESLEQVVAKRTEGLEAANRQLRHLATHDALTGLPNRVLLEDRLLQVIAHAEHNRQEFALLVVDLDRFKQVNDSLGHRAGDDLLVEVAKRIGGVASSTDTVARIGGDEFVMLLSTDHSRADVEHIAAKLINTVHEPVHICGVDVRTSLSIGIAFYPQDGTSADVLISHADAAMYCAKQRGRNNFQYFSPGMDVTTRERVKLESDLHVALAEGQFELYFQPKLDTVKGIINSAEALIRWRHPQRGLMLPDDFIPLAEECGLIIAMGEWVVREACRQCKEWQVGGLPALRVAVNVAASQFRHGNLLEMIRRALDDAQLQPHYLEIELTESAVMTDPEDSAVILEKLSAMGVLVSVDDFGTGYSSMSYLRRFPIDKLKIDRGFVKDLMTRSDDASIVQAIISLAHSLNLKVVAEGVESGEQLSRLKSMGCDQYQGYHFSPPLPATDFAMLLHEQQLHTMNLTDFDATRTHSKLAAYRRS